MKSRYLLILTIILVIVSTKISFSQCGGATNISAASLPIVNQSVSCTSTALPGDLHSGNVTSNCSESNYMSGQEALYTFTPTISADYLIEYSGQEWSGIFVHSTSCPASGGVCVDANGAVGSSNTLTVSLSAGTLYYIWFDVWSSPPDSPCPGTFSLSKVCSAPTVSISQTCSGDCSSYDLDVQVTNLGSAVSVDITDGTTTYETSVGTGTYTISGITSGKVIYVEDASDSDCEYTEAFSMCNTCPAPTATITQTCDPDFTSYDLEVEVTGLGGAASVNITDGSTTYESGVGLGTYTILGLTSGITIYVEYSTNANINYSEVIAMCDVCNDAPSLPADECAGAPIIDLSQAFIGSTNCTYTASGGSPSGCGTIENDSWMRFIAGSTDVEVEYTIGNCTLDDGIQLVVFSGACGSLTEISGSCVNPTGENITGTWSFSGMTIGDTYYIRIDGWAGDLCDYYFEPVSGVVITPDNDLCADAMTLTCGDSDIASNILATDTDAPTACSGGGTTAKGVWYIFTGTGQEVTVSTDNTGTNFDTQINVFSGTCGSLTCVGGDDDSGTGTSSLYTFLSSNGTDYYIYVDGDGAAEGQFEISVSCDDSCIANPGNWQY